MIPKGTAVVLSLAALAALALSALSFSTSVTSYHSRERYCLRLQARDGRVALLYDGGLDVAGPWRQSFDVAGVKLDTRITLGWQFAELSVPMPYVIALLGLYPSGFATFAYVRYRRRRRAGHCLNCGYDLTGNVSGVCPECGTTIEDSGPMNRGVN